MKPQPNNSAPEATSAAQGETYWWADGSLLHRGAVRPVAFFAWNAQTFVGRWTRLVGLVLLTPAHLVLSLVSRRLATRLLYALLRGISRDRLDLLGEEYFQYVLKPHLYSAGVAKLKETVARDRSVVLVSRGLDHIMRPLAAWLGVERLIANRLEFRDGLATGRLLEPVVRPPSLLGILGGSGGEGRTSAGELARNFRLADNPGSLRAIARPSRRQQLRPPHRLVVFNSNHRAKHLSIRETLAGKNILLIGVTGFIAKVFLVKLLTDLPNLGKIYLLIRRQRSTTALRRFERIVEESPVFDAFHEQYGDELARFLAERIEVVEGDVSRPGLGLAPELEARLAEEIDVVVNSAGLTDFNPDLRLALATNVDSTVHLLDFLRHSRRAALLHLSTCYVAGARDGRVPEELPANYTPVGLPEFDAEQERQALHELVDKAEARAESAAVFEALRKRTVKRASVEGLILSGSKLEEEIRKTRTRWLRNHLMDTGRRRAHQFGWPNTYTYTKSLGESLIAKHGSGLPVAIVRPSIVETSLEQPFRGWNEGINTSAPLSHLLGTYFRQLPSNERKCLDLVPVDLICRGMLLVAAALLERRHERVYQLATSANNPCNMRRSIELTGLAHRKHYRAQEGLEHWLRSKFDTIPVSKRRYQELSAPRQRVLVGTINRLLAPFFKKPPLARRERNLDRVAKLIELYEPFILENEHVFEADNVELLSAALPPEEKAAFGYDATALDWWEYWINIHVPALRKWCYPLLEGRPLESRPPRSFQFPAPQPSLARESRPTTPSLRAQKP